MLERYLDPIELIGAQMKPACSVEYEGPIDADALSKAFRFLCTRYPVLRASIHRDRKGYLLHVPSTCYPELLVLTGNLTDLLREIRHPPGTEHGLFRLILMRDKEDCGHVALQVNHAVMDAGALGLIFNEFWQLYADVSDNSRISVEPTETLPLPPSELMRQRWNELGPRLPDVSELNIGGTGDVHATSVASVPILQRTRLSQQDTNRLLTTARLLQTSVHAIICGAILAGLRGVSASVLQPAPMVCFSWVDLRNRVQPPIVPTDATNFGFTHRADVTVSGTADPVAIGRDIKHQLEESLRKRSVELLPKVMLNTPLESHLSQIFVSNAGVIATLPRPRHVRFGDFRIWPSATLQSSERMTHSVYGVFTYDGQLEIMGIFPTHLFSNTQVNEIVDRYVNQIAEIIVLSKEHQRS